MNIAVAVKTNSLDGIISGRFERSKWMIIINTENNSFSFSPISQDSNDKNQILNKIVEELISKKIDAILTESCGPKALQFLAQKNIKVYMASDMTIVHAVEKFKINKLREFSISI